MVLRKISFPHCVFGCDTTYVRKRKRPGDACLVRVVSSSTLSSKAGYKMFDRLNERHLSNREKELVHPRCFVVVVGEESRNEVLLPSSSYHSKLIQSTHDSIKRRLHHHCFQPMAVLVDGFILSTTAAANKPFVDSIQRGESHDTSTSTIAS